MVVTRGLFLVELQRRAVDAVADARRARPVGEQMPEVAAARGAYHLCSRHPEGRIALLVDRVRVGRGVEGGPAAARVVLRLGLEEDGPAAGAAVRARLEGVVVLAGERRLSALLPEDAVFLG